MPTIRWARQTKIQNKALGLPGPDTEYAGAGTELKVDVKTLDAITKRYGSAAFEVIPEAPKVSAKPKDKK